MDCTKGLKETLSHLHSCMPKGVEYTPNKYGGTFTKGKRKIFVNIDYRKNDTSFPKISKYKDSYGVMLDRSYCKSYEAIRSLVRKGLGIKD